MIPSPETQGRCEGPHAASGAPSGGSTGSGPLPGEFKLVPRPHLQLSGAALIAIGLPDRRRQLSAAEAQLWNLMQQPMTVQEALQRCGPDADLLIKSFLHEGLCELVEPAFPGNRRRILIVEPHGDDAILSLGGTMWLRRHECIFVIATMASRSNHARYRDLGGNHDINTVTEIRRREGALAARMLGGEYLSVGMTDAALRYRDFEWTPDFYRRHRMSIDASISRAAGENELRRWTDALRRLVTEQQPPEIWFPLGGPHADHMLTADACLGAFTADPSLVENRILRVYQEVPYAVRYPDHMNTALEALRRAGAVLEAEITSIAPVLAEKRRLASVYESQEIDEMFAAGGDHPELSWKVRALPRQLPATGFVSRATSGDATTAAGIAAWVARNRDAPLVRVLLTTPTGRWQADLNLLCTAFPRARFQVCAAAAAGAEILEVSSARVDTRIVAGGTSTWLLECVRLGMSRGAPILVHAGSRRVRHARLLSGLWLGSDAMVLASMDQLGSALRIGSGED
jgi:LmbE family N-acetylglucosaminyl deacetylase